MNSILPKYIPSAVCFDDGSREHCLTRFKISHRCSIALTSVTVKAVACIQNWFSSSLKQNYSVARHVLGMRHCQSLIYHLSCLHFKVKCLATSSTCLERSITVHFWKSTFLFLSLFLYLTLSLPLTCRKRFIKMNLFGNEWLHLQWHASNTEASHINTQRLTEKEVS